MGEVAASVLEHTRAGEDAVLGVIPESMAGEDVSSKMLGRTLVVADMHERKAAMAREADAFVALPGGCAPWTRRRGLQRGAARLCMPCAGAGAARRQREPEALWRYARDRACTCA